MLGASFWSSLAATDLLTLLVWLNENIILYSWNFSFYEKFKIGEIRVSNEKTLTAEIAHSLGIYKWFDKMVNFSDQLRRLKVDYYEYVSMKVIILLTSGSVKCFAF